MWDAARTCVFERSRAIPQKQHNCVRFVVSKLRAGNYRKRFINTYWFQLGRALMGPVLRLHSATVWWKQSKSHILGFSLLFQISCTTLQHHSHSHHQHKNITLHWQLTFTLFILYNKGSQKRKTCKYSTAYKNTSEVLWIVCSGFRAMVIWL